MELETLLSNERFNSSERVPSVLEEIHFASARGHDGKINCVTASEEVDYIVSGGEDYTARIWVFEPDKQAYNLICCVACSAGAGSEVGYTMPNSLGIIRSLSVKSAATKLSKELRSDEERVGVTAVACAGSRKDALVPGVMAKVAEDDVFIQEEMDYIDDLEWDDSLEELLGYAYRIDSVNNFRDTVKLQAGDQLVELPKSCVLAEAQPYRDGPVICGTSDGDVAILDIVGSPHERVRTFPSRENGNPKLHTGAVNDIGVLRKEDDKDSFVVVTASEDGECAMIDIHCEEVTMSVDDREARPYLKVISAELKQESGKAIRLQHRMFDDPDGEKLPVLKVRTFGEDSEGVSFATLARDGVRLWTSGGEFLMKLSLPKRALVVENSDAAIFKEQLVSLDQLEPFVGLAVVNKFNGSLLFAATPSSVAVWFVDDGMVTGTGSLDRQERLAGWRKALDKYKDKGIGIAPVSVYGQSGQLLDIDQSGEDTVFAIGLNGDFTCSVWNLRGVDPQRLSVKPSSPASVLVKAGCEKIQLELLHPSQVCDCRVFEDPEGDSDKAGTGGAGGPALVVGCKDGTVFVWDLEGSDKGQVYAQMRSLHLLDFLPVVLLFIGFVQVLSYAFGPTIPWREEVKTPATKVKRWTLFDWSYELEISREAIFWPQIMCVMVLQLVCICFALLGAHQSLEELKRSIQNSAQYKSETKQASCCAPFHGMLRIVQGIHNLVKLISLAVSSVAVVPITQVIASAFDCVPDDLSHESESCVLNNITCHLASAPTVECYEGNHWRLVMMLSILTPVSLFLLIPFAACGGDIAYVPRETIYDFKFWREDSMWRSAAKRKATVLSLSFMHPYPENFFRSQLAELFIKIALPVIQTENTRYPFRQMLLVLVVSVLSAAGAIFYPPFLEPKYLAATQTLKVFTAIVMAIGLLTVYLHDPHSMVPVYLLGVTCLLMALIMSYILLKVPLSPIRDGILAMAKFD
eukprot:TRINITY_DN76351_c0_g1_i1.p1 TRINITY_DN76351_c0_g1~~TRINITY_DN76351_c0_g1_i1.p1  ORF type:complete len:989 (+),score=159.06 TRINITY_DN76351_c0_g1_i1:48-2969(+)